MTADTDTQSELKALLAELREANRRVAEALNADPSGQVGSAFRRFIEADDVATAVLRRVRKLSRVDE